MVAIIIVLALFASGIIWAVTSEARTWNNGLCAKYGEPWEHFDTDSQGGRGYKCRDVHIWISWPVDRISTTRGPAKKAA